MIRKPIIDINCIGLDFTTAPINIPIAQTIRRIDMINCINFITFPPLAYTGIHP